MASLGVMVWLAYLVSATLIALWYLRRTKAVAIAALLWLAYSAYESLMALRVLCSGDCNIRVDLLVIYPLLLIALARALISTSKTRLKPR